MQPINLAQHLFLILCAPDEGGRRLRYAFGVHELDALEALGHCFPESAGRCVSAAPLPSDELLETWQAEQWWLWDGQAWNPLLERFGRQPAQEPSALNHTLRMAHISATREQLCALCEQASAELNRMDPLCLIGPEMAQRLGVRRLPGLGGWNAGD